MSSTIDVSMLQTTIIILFSQIAAALDSKKA